MSLMDKILRRDAEVPEPQTRKDLAHSVEYRDVSINVREMDEEARTVDIAFSSDTPIFRQFFMDKFNEVLVHDAKSVRLERMNDGAALLMDHNPRDQIGVVQRARVEDGKGRATVRFSQSPRAREIFQDVQDGIRTKISVGYRIFAFEEVEGGDKAIDTVRITDWEPLEVSFVAVPADASVGVGRSNHQSEHQETTEMFNKDRKKPEERAEDQETPESGGGSEGGPTEQAAASREAPEVENREAINEEIREIGEKFGETELAEEVVELRGSVDDICARIRNKRNNVVPIQHRENPYVDVREKYTGEIRGFRNEEDAYRAGQWVRATLMGDRKSERWCKDHGMRVMSESVFSKGGAVVPTEMETAIIDLRKRYGVARRLLRVIPMTTDTLTVPRRVSGITAYAVGENASITASDKEWDNVNLVARKWGALTKFSTEYAEDAFIDAAMDLSDEMAYAFAQKEDEAMVDGDGTSTYHGIVGFRPKLVDGSHTVGAQDASTGDNTLPEIVAGDLDTVRGILPDFAEANAKWLAHKTAKAVVFDDIARAAGGTTMVMVGNEPRDMYLGDEIVTSNAMPGSTTADYENTAMLLYGDFSLAATMGDRRGFRFRVLNELYAENDQIGVIGTTRFDINVHDLGDGSNAGPVVGLIGN